MLPTKIRPLDQWCPDACTGLLDLEARFKSKIGELKTHLSFSDSQIKEVAEKLIEKYALTELAGDIRHYANITDVIDSVADSEHLKDLSSRQAARMTEALSFCDTVLQIIPHNLSLADLLQVIDDWE